MQKELIMYGRRFSCSDQSRAIHFLQSRNVPYRFVDISQDPEAARRLESWVGHLSVPTLLIAQPGEVLPMSEPAPLNPGQSVRGQNRGTLITEPSDQQLENFLRQHSLL